MLSWKFMMLKHEYYNVISNSTLRDRGHSSLAHLRKVQSNWTSIKPLMVKITVAVLSRQLQAIKFAIGCSAWFWMRLIFFSFFPWIVVCCSAVCFCLDYGLQFPSSCWCEFNPVVEPFYLSFYQSGLCISFIFIWFLFLKKIVSL